MAASDEFPRGLVLQQQLSGTAPSLTLPASPGLSWVLTDVEAALLYFNTSTSFTCSIVDTNPNPRAFIVLGASVVTANEVIVAQGSWNGKITYPIGTALTIQFNGTAPSSTQNLLIAAYAV